MTCEEFLALPVCSALGDYYRDVTDPATGVTSRQRVQPEFMVAADDLIYATADGFWRVVKDSKGHLFRQCIGLP